MTIRCHPRQEGVGATLTEKVAFEDKYLQTVVGIIVRINSRTATIDPGDGTHWRVGFALLRHVLDV